MKSKFTQIFLSVFTVLLFSTGSLPAQKIVAFDKPGKVKRIRYYHGDLIKLKLNSGERVFGTIDQIMDSSFVVQGMVIGLTDVSRVFNTQRLAGFSFFSKLLFRAGLAYFPIVTVNRAINDDDPTFSQQAAIISGSMLATGIIFRLIANKSYKISEDRPLKILDLTP